MSLSTEDAMLVSAALEAVLGPLAAVWNPAVAAAFALIAYLAGF